MLKENIYGYCSTFEKYKYEEKKSLKNPLKGISISNFFYLFSYIQCIFILNWAHSIF